MAISTRLPVSSDLQKSAIGGKPPLAAATRPLPRQNNHTISLDDYQYAKIAKLPSAGEKPQLAANSSGAKTRWRMMNSNLALGKLLATRRWDWSTRSIVPATGLPVASVIPQKPPKSVAKKPIANDFWGQALNQLGNLWNGIKQAGSWLMKQAKKHSNTLLLAAQVAAWLTPGWQGVAIILAGYQLAKGASLLHDGIKKGNWQQTLDGGISLASAFAGGIGGWGAKTLTQGIAAASQQVSSLLDLFSNSQDRIEGSDDSEQEESSDT
ncbi:MAG: hypothetical protein HY692_05595 [Cyanobacteria bacterium NC_groundwater_1444_Ag_S-0.65um_54_12]|nr:hypothetical protein [Cyanobacteria bacterium NC_groundwater_1444_Ag_S-0.65um_54_12]